MRSKKLVYFAVVFFLAGGAFPARGDDMVGVLQKFFTAFQKKDFKSAGKYLSSLDSDYVKSINDMIAARAVQQGMQVRRITVNDLLEQSWRNTFDKEQKKKTLNRIKQLIAQHPDRLQNAEALKKKVDTLYEISLNSTFVPFSGKVIKKTTMGNYAVVVADAYISYSGKVLSKAKEFYKNLKLPTTPERDKHVFWKKNEYHFPVVYYMSKEGKAWKVVYFNRNSFPRDKFAKTLDVYEPEAKATSLPVGHPPVKKR